jgi:hypothetical protein
MLIVAERCEPGVQDCRLIIFWLCASKFIIAEPIRIAPSYMFTKR